MEYLMQIVGREGEEHTFPMRAVEMIGLTLDKTKSSESERYWKFVLSNGINMIESYEDITFERLMMYSNYFKEDGLDLNLKNYKGGTLQDFLVEESSKEDGFVQVEEGFKLVIQEDMKIKGVIALGYTTVEVDDEGEEVLVDTKGTLIAAGRTGSGRTQPTRLKVIQSQYTKGIDVQTTNYPARLEYALNGESILLANGNIGYTTNNSGVGDPIPQIVFTTRDESSRIMLVEVAEAMEGLDKRLKKMLLNEALHIEEVG